MNPARKGLREALKSTLLSLEPPALGGAPVPVNRAEVRGVAIHWPERLAWPPGRTWVEPLFHGLRARVPVTVHDIPQQLPGTVVIHFCRGERAYPVAINFSDYPELISSGRYGGRSQPLALEFKMQYRRGGYGVESIVPGGFIAESTLVDWFADWARLMHRPNQFDYDVYGRFGLEFASEVRGHAIEVLRSQSRVRFYGGEAKVRYREFLKEIARARVCLDLPGNGPFCFRLVNYLAVGACVISPPHATRMPVPLIDGIHIIYTRPDMSDLIDLCELYVGDDGAREAVVAASRDYYRRHLHWRSLSDYYLRTMLDRLPA